VKGFRIVASVAALAFAAAAADGLTVEGRQLRLVDGAFVPEDGEWLAARARYLLAQRQYGRANDLATLLAGAGRGHRLPDRLPRLRRHENGYFVATSGRRPHAA